MDRNVVHIGNVKCGEDQPLTWIAGPCVIESRLRFGLPMN